jgi:hypothetical protein
LEGEDSEVEFVNNNENCELSFTEKGRLATKVEFLDSSENYGLSFSEKGRLSTEVNS